jgi:hypothetical protein
MAPFLSWLHDIIYILRTDKEFPVAKYHIQSALAVSVGSRVMNESEVVCLFELAQEKQTENGTLKVRVFTRCELWSLFTCICSVGGSSQGYGTNIRGYGTGAKGGFGWSTEHMVMEMGGAHTIRLSVQKDHPELLGLFRGCP